MDDDFEIPYSPLEMSRQVRGLRGDKKMTEFAIDSKKSEMAEMLKGEMGRDMMKVLNGEEFVELPKKDVRKYKIISWFKRLLRKF